MNALAPRPLVPDQTAAHRAAMASISKAALAIGLKALSRSQHGQAADKMVSQDYGANLLVKAASQPFTIGNTPLLAQISLAFVDALIPVSASAALIARSLQLQWDRAAEVRVPGFTMPHAAFVGESQAIPVSQGMATIEAVLTPFKLAVLTELTGEMMRSSNAEALVRAALLANVGPSLDAAMFNSNAGVAGVSPPGLMHNVTPLTGTAGGGLGAIVGDLQSLAERLAPVAGNGGIVLIASSRQAVALALTVPGSSPYPLLTSSALANGTVIAVAPQALATIVAAPIIEASQNAVIQEQEAPTGDVFGSGPVRNVYQTDTVALRFRLPCSWAMRSANGLSYITGTSW